MYLVVPVKDCIVGILLIKLVMLEWSESRSDAKFEFSMLRNAPVQIFEAIGATSGV